LNFAQINIITTKPQRHKILSTNFHELTRIKKVTKRRKRQKKRVSGNQIAGGRISGWQGAGYTPEAYKSGKRGIRRKLNIRFFDGKNYIWQTDDSEVKLNQQLRREHIMGLLMFDIFNYQEAG
jgi:hypothetical protein